MQAIQNHNLFIALGGVTRGATTHFPISVSEFSFSDFLKNNSFDIDVIFVVVVSITLISYVPHKTMATVPAKKYNFPPVKY